MNSLDISEGLYKVEMEAARATSELRSLSLKLNLTEIRTKYAVLTATVSDDFGRPKPEFTNDAIRTAEYKTRLMDNKEYTSQLEVFFDLKDRRTWLRLEAKKLRREFKIEFQEEKATRKSRRKSI